MSILIKKRYLRLVRKAYRFLRSPGLKKHTWLQKILSPMFNRELWHPCRETASMGLAAGLFVSMITITPGQMILAGLWAVRLRANVPLAIAACWVSNPLTQLPIILFQKGFGDKLRDWLNIPLHPEFEKFKWAPSALSYIIGVIASATLLAIAGYLLVNLLSALLPKLIPRGRYKRAKAKIMARMDRQDGQNQ
ncbi:DUF2062 domain-containing protein [Akkermansiaceae bacterium]|nr:DUF2062 domain-containing protein [Akkermansiaceae bacterium]